MKRKLLRFGVNSNHPFRGRLVAIRSGEKTISNQSYIEDIILVAGEERYEVAAKTADKGLDGISEVAE